MPVATGTNKGSIDKFLQSEFTPLEDAKGWNQRSPRPQSFLSQSATGLKVKTKKIKNKSEKTKIKQEPSQAFSAGATDSFVKDKVVSKILRGRGRGSRRGSTRQHLGLPVRGKRRQFRCSYCDYTSARRYNTERHIRLRHPNYRYKCPLTHCTQILLDEVELRMHLQCHSSAALYLQCQDCGAHCGDYDALLAHQTTCAAHLALPFVKMTRSSNLDTTLAGSGDLGDAVGGEDVNEVGGSRAIVGHAHSDGLNSGEGGSDGSGGDGVDSHAIGDGHPNREDGSDGSDGVAMDCTVGRAKRDTLTSETCGAMDYSVGRTRDSYDACGAVDFTTGQWGAKVSQSTEEEGNNIKNMVDAMDRFVSKGSCHEEEQDEEDSVEIVDDNLPVHFMVKGEVVESPS